MTRGGASCGNVRSSLRATPNPNQRSGFAPVIKGVYLTGGRKEFADMTWIVLVYRSRHQLREDDRRHAEILREALDFVTLDDVGVEGVPGHYEALRGLRKLAYIKFPV